MLKTPARAPKANAFCERFRGSVRRECLDHLIVLGERHGLLHIEKLMVPLTVSVLLKSILATVRSPLLTTSN
jgi:transposase InsO family protein